MDYQNELNQINKIPYTINTETRMLYNPQLKGAYASVPGVMGMILLLISAMMTSIAIVKEKELGTMEVLLVSPNETVVSNYKQGNSLFCYFAYKCCDNFNVECICSWAANRRKSAAANTFHSNLYFLCAFTRAAHFHNYRNAASGNANISAWINASGCNVKRLCFSNSKHADHTTNNIKRCSGKVVYHYC